MVQKKFVKEFWFMLRQARPHILFLGACLTLYFFTAKALAAAGYPDSPWFIVVGLLLMAAAGVSYYRDRRIKS